MKQLMPITTRIDDASGVDETYYSTPAHPNAGEWEAVTAVFTPYENVGLDAANYRTLTLKNGATALDSWTSNSSGGTALAAGTPYVFDLSGNGINAEFTANAAAMTVESVKNGTGAALKGDLTVVYQRVS